MKKIILILFAFVVSLGAQAQCQAIIDYQINATGNQVQFSDSSQVSGPYYSFWDFGDGTSGSGTSFTKTYNITGSITACLIIMDSARTCSDTTCVTFNVTGGSSSSCNALFYYNVMSSSPLGIDFDNRSSGSYSYLWEFGDGDSSTVYQASHMYSQFGRYYVKLTAFDSTGAPCDTFSTYVIVGNTTGRGCQVTANAIVDSTNYRIYNFYAYTSDAIGFKWYFGDGDSSDWQYPSHQYSTDSAYLITLISYDSAGNACDTIYLTVNVYSSGGGCTGTIANSTARAVATGYQVTFMGSVNSAFASVVWDFGDGNTDSGYNVNHIYADTGTYNVVMYIFNNGVLCDSVTKTVSVEDLCQASFYVGVDTSTAYTLYLIENSTGVNSGTQYYWDFGDGSTSTSRTPTHSYSSFGAYRICLTIWDSSRNCSSTFCDSIGMDSNGNVLKKDGFTMVVISENDILSIKDKSLIEPELKLYPNPSNGETKLKISASEKEEYSIHVYSAEGKLVESRSITVLPGQNEVLLDFNQKAKGLYFILISSELYQGTLRFIRN
ncbi:PKD domain-containing protein [bacterium]|nr:PKD domain-containing protein [bacterium]